MSDFDPLDTTERDAKAEADQARVKLADAQVEADLKWLMADARGRRLVRMVLEWGGVWRSSYTGEALGTAFREGERNIACKLLALTITHCPERIAELMMNEAENAA